VFALGTTGEGPSLGTEEKRAVVRATCERVAGRCPVYVGVMDNSLAESIRLSAYARECGADAAVITPSPYFPAGVREQIAFFREFVAASELPVILYNIPQMTKTALAPEVFEALLNDPRIIGVKDSSGNFVYFRRLQHIARRRPGFSMLIGSEELLADAVLLGANGGVTGGANVYPELCREVYLAARNRNFEGLEAARPRLMEFSCRLYSYSNGSYIIAAIKAMLNVKGLCEPWVLPPLQPADASLAKAARELMAG